MSDNYDEHIEWAKSELRKLQSKKQDIILTVVNRLEEAGMPAELICEYLSDKLSSEGYVSGRYIREVLDDKYKNKTKQRKTTSAEPLPHLTITNEGNTVTEPNDTSKDSNSNNSNPPSFTTAGDLIPKVGRKEFYEEPLSESVSEDLQNIIKEKDEEISRIKTELLELREAVTKTSFKPAKDVKSFTFNDLPTPDDINTFVFKKIKFPDLRNQLVILSARGGRLLNAYLERAD